MYASKELRDYVISSLESGGQLYSGTCWTVVTDACAPITACTLLIFSLFPPRTQPCQGYSRRWHRTAEPPVWIHLRFEVLSSSLSLNLEATSMITIFAHSVLFLNCLVSTDSKMLKNFCATWSMDCTTSLTRPNAGPNVKWLSQNRRKKHGTHTASGLTTLNSSNCSWGSLRQWLSAPTVTTKAPVGTHSGISPWQCLDTGKPNYCMVAHTNFLFHTFAEVEWISKNAWLPSPNKKPSTEMNNR